MSAAGRRLYMLSFDHRGSFKKGLMGIAGEPTGDEHRRISELKTLICEGFGRAIAEGAPRDPSVRYNPDGHAGLNRRQAERLARLSAWLRARDRRFLFRAGGRDHVCCIVLGRGASLDRVAHWLEVAAPVAGYIGFAIGRTIWLGALSDHVTGRLERQVAVEQIAANHRRMIDVYASCAQTTTC
jgi:myo-inositol catabolism protein IolC